MLRGDPRPHQSADCHQRDRRRSRCWPADRPGRATIARRRSDPHGRRLSQEHSSTPKTTRPVRLTSADKNIVQSERRCSRRHLGQAAVNAKLIAAAVRTWRPSTTVDLAAQVARQREWQRCRLSCDKPFPGGWCRIALLGWAKYKNPARPPAVAITPSHSVRPTANRNQIPSTMTKKISSVVKMGWTTESRPRCRAMAWSRNEATMRTNPNSQTPATAACGSAG